MMSEMLRERDREKKERIVLVSNFTETLDIFNACKDVPWTLFRYRCTNSRYQVIGNLLGTCLLNFSSCMRLNNCLVPILCVMFRTPSLP